MSDVYIPDDEITAVLERWLRAKTAQAAAAAREDAVWQELNALLDRRLGLETPAVFVMRLGKLDPAKAGRAYPRRGGGTDFDQVAELVRARLGDAAYRRYFTEERVTVVHPNRDAIAAAGDPKVQRIVAGCTTEGDPVLTRVPPQKASKQLAREAVPLPS